MGIGIINYLNTAKKVLIFYLLKINRLINSIFMVCNKKFLTFAVINTVLITNTKRKL
jgi:hypothetical protein